MIYICRILTLVALSLSFSQLMSLEEKPITKPPVAAPSLSASYSGGLTLALRNAIWHGENHKNAVNLILDLSAENGQWRRVFGNAQHFSTSHHFGLVDRAEISGDSYVFEVDCLINGDEWLPGSYQGTWLITLNRDADGNVNGTWQGRFKGRDGTGVVEGITWDLPAQDEAIVPPQIGEHPRLLFRQSDVPELQKKLASPFGQAYLKSVDTPESQNYLGLALLYAITGEQSYADRVQNILEGGELENIRARGFGTGGYGHTQIAQALTYDLAYNGLSPEFRRTMRDKMIDLVSGQQGLLQIEHPNHHPCSNYYGPGYGTAAITALAYAGEVDYGIQQKPEANKLKSLLGGKFASKPPPVNMDLTPPLRRDVKKLSADLAAKNQTEADALWPKAHPKLFQQFIQGERHMYYHYRWGMGTGGFQAETGGYAHIASRIPTIYASLYRNMMGRDVSPHADVSVLMVRRLVQSILTNQGKHRHVVDKLSSATGLSSAWFAYNFPIIPESYQPMVLSAWNYIAGITSPETAANALIADAKGRQSSVSQALIFVNYPLDMVAQPLDDLPLHWGTEFGHHSFRSAWSTTGQDAVFQVYAKAKKIRGWNHPNAGTFRLSALGHSWVKGSNDRVGFRLHEPCVLLPHNRNINQGSLFPVGKGAKPIGKGSGLGFVTLLETEADGSARITVDLNDVYASTKVDVTPKGHRQRKIYDNNLLRIPENIADSGISGKRAWGIDYSGESGAPVTLIMVDEIHGGDTRSWQWPYPVGKKTGLTGSPEIHDNGFTLRQGGVTLRCTFVTPLNSKPYVNADAVEVGQLGNSHKSFKGAIPRIVAEGNGHFIAVITISSGDHPTVSSDGTDLTTAIRVGDVTYRYDGTAVRW